MKFSLLSKRWFTIVIHIAAWTLLFSLPYLLRPLTDNNSHHSAQPHEKEFFYLYLVNCVLWIGFFYINSYLVSQFIINQKKYIHYAVSLVLLFAVLFGINSLTFKLLLPDIPFVIRNALFFYIFPSVFIMACSTAYTLLRNKIETDRLAKEKETEHLKTDLSFLRSQVAPHFLFNVLNNMVSLARKKSDQLEPSLIKLSSLLRYMLYETDEEKVLLYKEIEYLQSYIDLQIQRFGSKIKVSVDIGSIDKNYYIEPMLLIPFVENAFKHGTGSKINREINIELCVKDNQLRFFVSNYYDASLQEIKDKTSGIGLQNVQRRLDLLYKKEHSLDITNKDNRFTVILQLKLH